MHDDEILEYKLVKMSGIEYIYRCMPRQRLCKIFASIDTDCASQTGP